MKEFIMERKLAENFNQKLSPSFDHLFTTYNVLTSWNKCKKNDKPCLQAQIYIEDNKGSQIVYKNSRIGPQTMNIVIFFSFKNPHKKFQQLSVTKRYFLLYRYFLTSCLPHLIQASFCLSQKMRNLSKSEYLVGRFQDLCGNTDIYDISTRFPVVHS